VSGRKKTIGDEPEDQKVTKEMEMGESEANEDIERPLKILISVIGRTKVRRRGDGENPEGLVGIKARMGAV